MTIFRWLMAPSNAVCDALGIANEQERGIGMLVNTLVCTTIGVTAFFIARITLPI